MARRGYYQEFTRIFQNNIYVGCSIGCKHCNARRSCVFHRLQPDFAVPTFHRKRIGRMLTNFPQTQYLTFMSDYSQWDNEHREMMLRMTQFDMCRDNQYLLLTQRPAFLWGLDYSGYDNVWVGVTVTMQDELDKLWAVQGNMKAAHWWMNVEPMLAPVSLVDSKLDLDLDHLDWVVIGAMTQHGHKYDPSHDWVIRLADECHELGIPVAMKHSLEKIVGETLWVREYPEEFPVVGKFDDATTKEKEDK